MRFFVVSLLLMALALSSCREKNDGGNSMTLVDASRQELVTALEERDSLLRIVKDISRSVNQIKRLEHLVSEAGNNPGEDMSANARLVADIRAVRLTLDLRRQQLAVLEEKLQNSGFYTTELREVVDELRHSLESQSSEINRLRAMLVEANERIGSLCDAVDSLSTTVISVSSELDEAQTVSSNLETELNACFYAVASKSELKRHNVIETSFLRKTKILKSDFDKDFFNTADKRTLDSVALGPGKPQILTSHPSSSYEIVDRDGGKMLHITDQASFWRTTNFLVVQTD